MNVFSLDGSIHINGTSALDAGGGAPFELRIGPFVQGELEVISFKGKEKLNTPFVYDVTFASSVAPEILKATLSEAPACLSLRVQGQAPRVIQGFARVLGRIGAAESDRSTKRRIYRVRIKPRLQLLARRAGHRLFEQMTAIEIARAVLAPLGIEPTIRLDPASYAPLPCVYQQGETDLQFLHHVLATAGVFYFFEHANGLLDALMPGATAVGALAGAIGGAAAGALGGGVGASAGGVGGTLEAQGGLAGMADVGATIAGIANEAEALAGGLTLLVLADQSRHTCALGTVAAAAEGIGAAASALGGALGGVASSIAGAVEAVTDILDQPDVIRFDDTAHASISGERIFSFEDLQDAPSKAVQVRDWNQPRAEDVNFAASSAVASADLDLAASINLSGPPSLSLNAHLDVMVDTPSIPASDLTVLEYQRDAGVPAAGEGAARRALSQLRSEWITARGTTNSRRLAPGYRFRLSDHPIDPVNGEYVVTEIRCEGHHPDFLPERKRPAYQSRFRCVPKFIDPLPKKPPPRGLLIEEAVVVGGQRGDACPDKIGRIQVRFWWAQPGREDEATLWVRRVEQWAGDGFGTQHIPRVGTEVLIGFPRREGGQPFVLGQLYSEANKPPFPLPREASKVGIRSQTIPRGPDYSEISVDDRPGGELVHIRSARDQETEVVRDQRAHVHGDRSLRIDGSVREHVGGAVTREFKESVTDHVLEDLREEVGGNRSEIVHGSTTEVIEGDRSRLVLGTSDTVTRGTNRTTFAADSVARHFSHHATVVAATGTTGSASAVLHVEGAVTLSAKREIEVTSSEGFTWRCGDSFIAVRKDSITLSAGTILLAGKTVQVTASDTAAVAAKTATIAANDSVTVTGATKVTLASSASVVLDSNATIEGTKVKLGSGGGGSSSGQQLTPAKKTTIKLTDSDGNPLPNERALLRSGGEGGPERVAVLDGDGQFTIYGEEALDIFFEECRLNDASPPPGDMRPYVIRQGDFLASLASRYGFDPDALWNHEKNETLRKAGRVPHILQPGDVLYIPEPSRKFVSLKMGQTNTFTVATKRIPLSVTFQARMGTPLANASCTYEGLRNATDAPTSTDANGSLALQVSTRQEPFMVVFPDEFLRFTVFPGHMDPAEETSGVLKRLGHLGYGTSPLLDLAGADTNALQSAFVGIFQIAQGKEPTGTLDDDTLDDLVKAHGV